jgi:glycosyltransferase involved in cell wall biosynthesis
MPDKRPTVSVIIKAYNEERHIAGAIESALTALRGIDGEVILADGASTDRTIEIAARYPIKIVRLDDAADRSCGAGAQLGFQYSSGEFVLLMDGDMRLQGGFVASGIGFLRDNPTVGGVGGAMINRDASALEYAQRVRRFDPDRGPGLVTRLGGCGLYRRAALCAVGHSTDRNLHGGEELELAARLRANGWTLAKIDCVAVEHYCRIDNPYGLLLRRMKTRNAFGPGEVIRAALGRPHFGLILRDDRNSRLCALVALWWVSMVAAAVWLRDVDAVVTIAALLAFPLVVMSWRWRSLRHGLYSVMAWNTQALCFLPGFLQRRRPPGEWMASTVVKDPSAHSAQRAAVA